LNMLLHVVRLVLLVVMTFVTIGLVVALAGPYTGPVEKVLLAVLIIGVVVASAPVRRIGSIDDRR
jgi:hypothetical protein